MTDVDLCFTVAKRRWERNRCAEGAHPGIRPWHRLSVSEQVSELEVVRDVLDTLAALKADG